MPQALDATAYIYEGLWINWTKGRVLGSTLTLTPSHAAILSPALAIIISIAGNQLWKLFQFTLHQTRATSKEKDFLYHQQQVTLRNTSTDLNTLWRLCRIAFAWRHQKLAHSGRRTLALAIWTLFHFVLVVLAGVFSSTFLEAGDLVLSRSPWCGSFNNSYIATVFDTTDLSHPALDNEYYNYINLLYSKVQNYVNICDESNEGCDTLPQDRLSFTSAIQNESCPFNNSTVCHSGGSGSIMFDTGYLSSHEDLGLNAPKGDRISLRMTTKCAPLNDRRFVTGWQNVPATSDSPAHKAVDAFYGTGLYGERNATFSYSNYRDYMECDNRGSVSSYMLNAQLAYAGGTVASGDSLFTPIPELQLSNADTALVFLMFDNAYLEPVDDPWFAATVPTNESDAYCDSANRVMYARDLPVTTLGCSQQMQVCQGDQASNRNCGELMGLVQMQEFVASPPSNWSDKQLSTLNHVFSAGTGASIYWVVNGLARSDPPLLALQKISQTMSLPLPDNQWQLEAQYWQTLAMATLQKSIVDLSTGQFSANTEYINQTMVNGNEADKWLCQNQTIRSYTYRSYNFFALVLILTLCTLIIIIGLSIEDIISCIRQRQLRYSIGKQDMWTTNSDLEMLRIMSELQTGAKWTRSKNGIPLAEPGHKSSINQLKPKYAYSRHNTSLSELKLSRSAKSSPLRPATPKPREAKFAFQALANEARNPSPAKTASKNSKNSTQEHNWGNMDIDEALPQNLSYQNDFNTGPTFDESQQYISAHSPMLPQERVPTITQLPEGWGVLPMPDQYREEQPRTTKKPFSAIRGSTYEERFINSYIQ